MAHLRDDLHTLRVIERNVNDASTDLFNMADRLRDSLPDKTYHAMVEASYLLDGVAQDVYEARITMKNGGQDNA